MEAVRRQPYRSVNHSKILFRILIGMLLVVVLASAIAIYFEQEKQLARIEARREALAGKLQEAAAELSEMRELQQIVGSDAYIERVAREQLGMVRPGEVVFTDR
ncbi:MAG: hypothetical protein GX821_06440 [Clostridiaceae bacterium]|nr:septum formation initiator family protein [Clostridiales bacterium]MDD4138932.1 septum formation initiator family protein [Eubacteriales bacterium]MDD4743101.1 septum formation initiator family protein [Eubacteriales bacterium]NLB44787.1 hypothetical protein [Clostridiaceae bacterium]NLM77306.1 hypothetical protein [Oscillospiraceae bacterium]